MKILANPMRQPGANVPVRSDPGAVCALLEGCPAHAPTPLVASETLARAAGIAALFVKDERARMGLGSFKALGAAWVIARDAAAAAQKTDAAGNGAGTPGPTSLIGRCYATASAGNHGLSLAAGARVFGARAVVYIAETVPEAFAERLRALGAEVIRAGAAYEESMATAARDAERHGWTLLSDSTWPGYDGGLDVMEGYLGMGAEIAAQIPHPPTHVFLQAGVGGLAAAIAAFVRARWGEAPRIVTVEPAEAPAIAESLRAGGPVVSAGGVSAMGRLDCKEPSLRAFQALAAQADDAMTLTDAEVAAMLPQLAAAGLATSPSGGAGLAGALIAARAGLLGLGPEARVLAILSEGPVDDGASDRASDSVSDGAGQGPGDGAKDPGTRGAPGSGAGDDGKLPGAGDHPDGGGDD